MTTFTVLQIGNYGLPDFAFDDGMLQSQKVIFKAYFDAIVSVCVSCSYQNARRP